MDEARLTRRASIARLGGFLGAALGVAGWRVASSEGATGPVAVASGAVSCVLTPEQTEGPYYISGEKLRRNITDGKPGSPLLLRAKVVDVSTCKPIKGAIVEIWHADAAGEYSGFGGGASSRTFLRGGQRTDASGIATIQTIYPGWYPGRTVHIHVKVHVGGNVVHTGQLYFSETITDAVYRKTPYSRRPGRSTRNATDSVYRNGGSKSLLALRKNGAGHIATITMGVNS
jgi:protocatechuate 3,4-dioxygenase beta subunit